MRKPTTSSVHDLIPKDLLSALPQIGETSEQQDPLVHIKLFDPSSSWTWFVIEYDPKERIGYGYVCGFEKELGSFDLAELEAIRTGPLKLRIERDLYFEPCRLSQLPDPYRTTFR